MRFSRDVFSSSMSISFDCCSLFFQGPLERCAAARVYIWKFRSSWPGAISSWGRNIFPCKNRLTRIFRESSCGEMNGRTPPAFSFGNLLERFQNHTKRGRAGACWDFQMRMEESKMEEVFLPTSFYNVDACKLQAVHVIIRSVRTPRMEGLSFFGREERIIP